MGKSLFICEKPSVGTEFAKALGMTSPRQNGYIEYDRYIITWAYGHLVTMSYPEKYDEKYKGKLEIIGMDCGDSDEKWKAAVKKYELPWKHVYVPKNSNVLDNYKIKGFPTKIVIGPDGTVLKTVVGESPEFYEYLDQYFL